MNSAKQLWSLFKFNTTMNPFIWFMLFGLDMPLFIPYLTGSSYHTHLSSLLQVQTLFMLGLAGMWILAPEMAQSWGANTGSFAGTEFLLTRAIDRPILYRSRSMFLYLLVLLIPLLSLLYSHSNPDLKVTEYVKSAQQLCLSSVPGAVLQPNPSGSRSPLISIPGGNVLVQQWQIWIFAVCSLAVQALLLVIYPLKRRLLIFYTLFLTSVFVPLFFDFHDIHHDSPVTMERLFFLFAAHQPLFWILTTAVFLFTQLACERRFTRLEQ